MKPILCIATLGVLLSGGFAPSTEWAPREFPVSFWCGPPAQFATPDRFKQIAAAGFNYAMPACEGPFTPEVNRKVLDGCKAAGIKAFVADDRMPISITGVPDAARRLDAIVADYSRHPALAGYFVADEPSIDKFAGLAEVVGYLRKKDPVHPAYINLFPNNAGPERFGQSTYPEYIRKFAETVKPFALSYDHYHFLTNGEDQQDFFENLADVQAVALAHEIPFWQIAQAIPHTKYRKPSEAEKRYDAFQTLAYGGKGLMFFTYWTPPGKDFEESDGIIKRDGTPTAQYDEVKRVNQEVRAVGKYLLNALHVATFQNGNAAPGGKPRPQGTPVRLESTADITVGVFRADTHLYVLMANRDYRNPVKTDVFLTTAGQPVERLNKSNGRWSLVITESAHDGEAKMPLSLNASEGELLRW